uniref:Uncharacterized protein n=1 Tax=Trichobilharzia regenti TaxID=157069 RepID=A0AA85JEH2_TRIRE
VTVSYKNTTYGQILLRPYFVSRGIRLIVSETDREYMDISFTLELYGCRSVLETQKF